MRYLYEHIDNLITKKMLFLTGPRQVGKSELLKAWLNETGGSYFSYDIVEDRTKLLSTQDWPSILKENTRSSIIGVDEFHKYSRWKNYLKGVFDKNKEALKIFVTGSARLDYFRRGGDSLIGRYEHLRLHPFSVGELVRIETGKSSPPPLLNWLVLPEETSDLTKSQNIFDRLYKFTGFPEPYTTQDPLFVNRWSRQRLELLTKEDLRDLSQLQEISLVEHLAQLLPERVGSPFSNQSLANVLHVAHGSITKWMKWLHALYIVFSLPVYSKGISKSLQKARKIYLWDYSQLEDEGKRFENLVALHLLKSCEYWTDLGYGKFDLWYLRDREKREVDFLITENNKPKVVIEAKLTPEWPSSLKHMAESIKAPSAIILTREHGVDIRKPQVRQISASKYLSGLV